MRKTLASLALGLTLSFAHGGIEETIKDDRAIISKSISQIELPIEMCQGYAQRVELVGKIVRAVGNSPYICGTNSQGKIILYDNNGVTSTVEVARDYKTPYGFRKEVEISGTRSFSDFKAAMIIDCKQNGKETDCESTMYTILENGLTRRITKGLYLLPYFGGKIEKFFKDEQDKVVNMINLVGEKIKQDPYGFLKTVKCGSNGVVFSPSEQTYVERSIIDNGFIKK
jgi:hypothetical protein